MQVMVEVMMVGWRKQQAWWGREQRMGLWSQGKKMASLTGRGLTPLVKMSPWRPRTLLRMVNQQRIRPVPRQIT
jgi:hypothetical protein